MPKIRILVVDDSVVFRRLVSDELSRDPELEVVGTAANGRIALAKLGQLSPDLVILDIDDAGDGRPAGAQGAAQDVPRSCR